MSATCSIPSFRVLTSKYGRIWIEAEINGLKFVLFPYVISVYRPNVAHSEVRWKVSTLNIKNFKENLL